jgi:hypothetical protein
MAKSTTNPTKASEKKPKPSNAKKGDKPLALLKDDALRRIRALTVVQQRISGLPIAAVAANLNIHPETVSEDVKWAKKHGLLETLEQRLLGPIAQKTLVVIEEHLNEGSLEAAKEGMKFIIHANQQKARREEKQENREFDLEEYLREKRAGAIDVSAERVPEADLAAEGQALAVLQGGDAGAPEGAPAAAADQDGAGAGPDSGLSVDAAADHDRRADAPGEHPRGDAA